MNQTLLGPVVLIKSAWGLFSKKWLLFSSIAALPTLLSAIIQILFSTEKISLIIVGVVVLIVAVVFGVISTPVLISSIRQSVQSPETKVSFGSAYRAGFGYFGPVLLIYIVAGLVGMGSLALLVIPGIIVGVYTAFYIFSYVIDGKDGFSALTESYALVKGRWWGVFGRILITGLLALATWLVVSGVNYLLAHSVGLSVAEFDHLGVTGVTIASILIGLIVTSLAEAFTTSYLYFLYESLKTTRTPEVSTVSFKKWLVAFCIIGPITLIVLPILAVITFAAVKHARELGQQARMAQIQQADSTVYTDSQGTVQGNRPGGAN